MAQCATFGRTRIRFRVPSFGPTRMWSAAVTCRRFALWRLVAKSRAASSGPGRWDAVHNSTAKSRLPKARTGPRTPRWSRLRRAVLYGFRVVQKKRNGGLTTDFADVTDGSACGNFLSVLSAHP